MAAADFLSRYLTGPLPGPALGDAGPIWDEIRSAQVPSQLAPRSVELGQGPIESNWSNWLQAGPVLYHMSDAI